MAPGPSSPPSACVFSLLPSPLPHSWLHSCMEAGLSLLLVSPGHTWTQQPSVLCPAALSGARLAQRPLLITR